MALRRAIERQRLLLLETFKARFQKRLRANRLW